MGGTSFDVSVVVDGHAARRQRGVLGGVWTALSVVDVESIGAGGGSIGWVDARGMLRVGPRSAGADPGPHVTATAGRRPRSPTRSSSSASSIPRTSSVGRSGWTRVPRAPRASASVPHWVCRARTWRGACARLRTRGWRRRRLAWRHSASTPASRRSSASGAAARCSLRTSRARSVRPGCSCRGSRPCSPASEPRRPTCAASGSAPCWRRSRFAPATIEKLARELAAAVDADLEHDGVERDDRSIAFEVDMRFAEQVFELQVPLPSATPDGAAPDAEMMDAVGDAFRAEYARRWTDRAHRPRFADRAGRARAIGTGTTPRADLEPVARRDTGAPPASARPSARCSSSAGRGAATTSPSTSWTTSARGTRSPVPRSSTAPTRRSGSRRARTARVDDFGTLVLEVNP